ncbi:MAG: RIP metalloprotease RseP [Lachnospiraceae bacterium]|nr:RIP metalloprotease RseP [Lachnospiraceae bacterium]
MSIIVAILVFSIIIIIHELGHFLLAKKNGIGVVEFSIGLGPTVAGFTKGETKYSIKLLPFGGMCQMVGEDSEQDSAAENAFYSKGVWQRFSVIFAGPFFNFILAFLLSVVVIGVVGYDPATVSSVTAGSPAAVAGLQEGDLIKEIDGDNVSIGREVDSYFLYNEITAEPVEIVYERDGKEYSTTIEPVLTKKYLLGFNYYPNTDTAAEVLSVSENYPFHLAGILPGDIVTHVNGVALSTGAELSEYMDAHPLDGSVVSVTYERNSESGVVSTTVELTPLLYQEGYTTGFTYNLYREKTDVLGVLKYSLIEVKYWIVTTVKNLGLLVTGQLKSTDVGGPVAIIGTIGDVYEQTQEQGNAVDVIMQMAYITILLSANLGVMNLLPIPALDGGKLLFTLIEAFRGKPIDREKEGMVHLIGMALLMILMVFIFFNDIKNVFFK